VRIESSRVVVATGYGGPEVLSLLEEPTPVPGAQEVLVQVRAAGVNPADYKSVRGDFGADPARLPLRVGSEAAGVVLDVGEEAFGPAGPIAIGDEVIAFRAPGAYATALVVPASAVVPKPGALPWEQAGGLMLAGVTAVHALRAVGLTAGETVLVHGAAGGVGHLAVQLAAGLGATVVGTASAGKHELLRELGAIPVAYGPGLVDRVRAAAPAGVAAAVDAVGSDEAVEASLELVADKARIATIAAYERGKKTGIKILGGFPGADRGTEIREAARLELVEAAGAGRLRVLVAATYRLEDAAEALREVMAGHVTGKVVLLP
jgi:NADPH:quinone reductase-like Zn-dependent oxidoreductase